MIILACADGTEAAEEYDVRVFFHPRSEPPDWIRPFDPWACPIYLWNPNDITDDYNISTIISDPGFKVEVDPSEVKGVGPNRTVTLNVTVIPPVGAERGTRVDTIVTATSMNHGYNGSLAWVLQVDRWKEVKLHPERTFVYIEPSEPSVTINISIDNVGDEVMSLHVQAKTFLEDVEMGHGVTVTLDVTDLELEPRAARDISMRIRVVDGPPISSEVGYETRIQVIDMDDKANSWWGKVRWAVKTRFQFSLDPPSGSVLPTLSGQCSTFQLKFAQRTNDLRGHEWTVEFPDPIEGWTLVHPVISGYTVEGEEGFVVGFIVRPSVGVASGDRWNVSIRFECENNPLLSFDAMYRFTAEEFHDVVVTVTPTEVSCSPGETVYIQVDIENRGNVPDPIVLNVRLLNESYGRFKLDETIELLEEPLPTGSQRQFNVSAHTSPLTTPGPNRVIVSCTWAGRTDEVSVTISVEEMIELIGIRSLDGPIPINPNEDTMTLDYQLWNRGNVALFVLIDTHVKPVESGVVVTPDLSDPDMTVLILPGNKFDLQFGAGTIEGRREFDFDTRGLITFGFFKRDGTVLFTDALEFIIVGPDLIIRSAQVISDVHGGEMVLVQVWIENLGSGSSIPTSVTVVGAMDNGTDHRVPVPSLGPGEETTVLMQFMAWGGTNPYQLLIDPHEVLIEDGTSSNRKLIEVTAGTAADREEGSFPYGPSVGVVVMLTAATLIAWNLRSRSRRGR